MRKLFWLVLLCGLGSASAIAQNNKSNTGTIPPSDAMLHGFTYDWDKGYAAICDYLLNPGGLNQEAKILVDRKDFPALNPVQRQLGNLPEKEIKAWMEKHSNEIIEAFKKRTDIVTEY